MSAISGRRLSLASRLRDETRGAIVIETALIAPLLVLMTIGTFEVSQMVSRQHELQGGAADATAVALAANQGAQTDVEELAELLRKSLNLNENQVTVTKVFRCDASDGFVATASECVASNSGNTDNNGVANGLALKRTSSYVKIELRDTFEPSWCKLGVGKPFTFKVDRMVQLS